MEHGILRGKIEGQPARVLLNQIIERNWGWISEGQRKLLPQIFMISQFIGWVSSWKDAASDPHVYELLHKRWSISYEHVHFKLKPTHHKSWSKSSSQYQTLPPVFLLKIFLKNEA